MLYIIDLCYIEICFDCFIYVVFGLILLKFNMFKLCFVILFYMSKLGVDGSVYRIFYRIYYFVVYLYYLIFELNC